MKYPIILTEKQHKEQAMEHRKKLERAANEIMKLLAKEECKVGDFTFVAKVINDMFANSFAQVEIEKICPTKEKDVILP